MAKVHFFYSTMNAGKSTALLQSAHNYHETGNETILFIPREDADKNLGLIKSRIGLSASAVVIDSKLKIYKGATHPHNNQNPKEIDFKSLNKRNLVKI